MVVLRLKRIIPMILLYDANKVNLHSCSSFFVFLYEVALNAEVTSRKKSRKISNVRSLLQKKMLEIPA